MDSENVDDKTWRERTNTRVVSLTNGEVVQNDRLDALEEQHAEHDRILRGDPEKDTGGVLEHLHDLQTGLNALRAIMAPDALGGGGVLNRLKALEKKEERETKRAEHRWQFWLALLGFISALTVAVVTNIDRIEKIFRPPPKIEKVRKKRPPVRRVEPRVVPMQIQVQEENDPPNSQVP